MTSDQTDYKALVAEARTGKYDSDTELIDRLADAVEALQGRVGCDHLDEPYRRLLAERDALRTQLDAMTTAVDRWADRLAARERNDWADWVDSRSAHVPGITVEQIAAALRSENLPFGVASARAGDQNGDE